MLKALPFLLLATTLMADTLELPLRSIKSLRSLSQEEAAKSHKADIEGTVLFVYSKHSAMIIHDGTGSCWVGTFSPLNDKIKYGSKVRVIGKTYIDCSYLANIHGAIAEFLGQGSIPEPRAATAEDLFAQWIDTQWIQIEALVVGTEEDGLAFTLVLDIGGKIFKADVPQTPDAAQRAAALMQRRVLFTGIGNTVVNDNRQMTGRHFLIPSFDQITPIETKAREFAPPSRKVANLLQSNNSLNDVSRVVGTITQVQKGGFYLRDETASTFVYAAGDDIYPAGSRVEVEGFASVAAFRPILRASRVNLIEKGEKPTALMLKGDLRIQPSLHNELVTMDCEFLAVREGPQETILQCRSGNTYFEAWLPKFDPILNELKPRDTLRLTGVYEVTTTHPIPRTEWANRFQINLADPNAIHILKRAPWWTFDRLMVALGIALGAILAFLVWTTLLRRQVTAQTKIISSQIEHATIKDERQRIARELHDTLEQDLTGLSMQLENAIEEIDDESSPAAKSLTLVNRMLRHCRIEARASVSDLRDSQLIARPLPETMKEYLEAKAKETGTTLDFSVEGSPQTLRSTTHNHLLRIAREALSNAQRHGKATRVRCHLAYTNESVTLELEDNGRGFDTSLPPPEGHFGLTGMRERANKIHAQFSLISHPGHGTKIEVVLPSTSPEALPLNLKPE